MLFCFFTWQQLTVTPFLIAASLMTVPTTLKLDSKNEALFQTHCESWHNGFFGVCIWRYHPRSRPWSFESTPYTSPISPSRSSCSLWFSPTPYFEANGNNGNPKVIAVTMTFMNMMKGFILEHHTLGKLQCWLCRLLSWMSVLQLDVVPRTDDVRVDIGMTVTGWSCLE